MVIFYRKEKPVLTYKKEIEQLNEAAKLLHDLILYAISNGLFDAYDNMNLQAERIFGAALVLIDLGSVNK